MEEEPDIIGAFYDRVRRHVRDALKTYQNEQQAVAVQMSARGLANSRPHLARRVEVLSACTQALTDQCFEDVTRLPGTQSMHRTVHADFLEEQLDGFIRQAEGAVIIFNPGPAATSEIKKRIADIRETLQHDLRDFQAGLWRPRSQGGSASVTNNTVNIHGPNVGLVQQAGEGASQSAVVHFNASAVQTALEDFVAALKGSDISDQIKSAAMIEVETIQPQLKKPTPNVSIVREGLHSLRNILEGVAAGVLSTKLVAVLVAAGMAL